MTGSGVTNWLGANTPETNRRASTEAATSSRADIPLRDSNISSLIKPQIFSRFWSTGLLDREDLQTLQAQEWTRRTVEARTRFQMGRGFCVLASGLAARYGVSDAEEAQSTALIVPGDICDYSVATGTEPRARLVALTKSSYLWISAEQAIALAENAPNVLAAILAQLVIDRAVSEELLFSIARRTALERTAHFLCELEYRLRRMGLAHGGRFRLPMTQAEIGRHLGLTPVHVNRTMQELRRRHFVRSNGSGVELCDQQNLQQLAAFSPHYLNLSAGPSDQAFDA
ncbi:Crp/Fnr family transcriptional regulator [Devosia subaequoris]|uniref:Crp/Fnr family transcriptional regulator n=1 Tax=Devosia subaequoris TaxID=395930 RepID=UPI001AEE8F89|nr:Crp/Fnr family transcriptional regulator [Devosia subaequoris]MCP1208903.1 Crp/Fnr family transcriptional regulator [Devosia subaequoris]